MNLIGIPIGFYGYLFPGNINLMVLDLYSTARYNMLFWVLTLILFFESIYCAGTLLLIDSLRDDDVIIALKYFSFGLLFMMGGWMLLDSKKSKTSLANKTLLRGLISIIINPQQIPFWVIISISFEAFISFGQSVFSSVVFLLFNAIGTLAVMLVYMKYGSRVLKYFDLRLSVISRILGFFYIVTSAYVLFQINN